MSGVKESIRLRFPDNPIFQESNQEWYTKLREGMGTAISRRCILDGVPISRQGKHVGRELVQRIGHALLLENSIESIERRACIVMTFASVGRAGEVAFCQWNNSWWNFDEVLLSQNTLDALMEILIGGLV